MPSVPSVIVEPPAFYFTDVKLGSYVLNVAGVPYEDAAHLMNLLIVAVNQYNETYRVQR